MLDRTDNPVRDHNRAAAALWNAGGRAYDNVSFAISDALAHTAQRLAPKPGERVLDVATGTGWSARNAARMGAQVTGIDIAPNLLEAAEALSAGFDPAIDYRLADAEALPFGDSAFDGVISTFGVMFAADQAAAAAEIARVTKPGGRLALASWVPDGAVAEFFGLIASHSHAQAPDEPPVLWGDPDHVRGLLGDAFDLTFERGFNHAYHTSEDAIWQWYVSGFGPLKMLSESLDDGRRAALKADVDAYHRHYRVEAGLCVDREYLVTIGTRR
ncbi:MAG: methyltransferase domain-containing protein [Rhizobiaceae bacterium]